MATYWEVAAHSAYGMFSKYKHLIVNLFFPASFFGVRVSFPDHCLRVPLYYPCSKQRR